MPKRLIMSSSLALMLIGCAPAKADSLPPFHALGTEPWWGITVDDGQIHYDPGDGRDISMPAPQRVDTARGYGWQTPRISVEVTYEVCSDGGSMRVYPADVRVTVDNRTVIGCGGYAFQDALGDSAWQVTNVTFTDVEGENHRVEFAGDRMIARVGCRTFSGNYTRNTDGALRLARPTMTRSGCPAPAPEDEQDPDRDQERALVDMFGQEVYLSFSRPGTLAMGNEHGGILLQRIR